MPVKEISPVVPAADQPKTWEADALSPREVNRKAVTYIIGVENLRIKQHAHPSVSHHIYLRIWVKES
eukprot:1009166-Pelagomonas_calceolata.AAC.1